MEGFLVRGMTCINTYIRKITECNIKNGLEELNQRQESKLGDISQLGNDDFYLTKAGGSESGEKY